MNKVCSKCKEVKSIIEFARDKSKCDGFYSSCKECSNKRRRNKYKDYSKKYRRENVELIKLRRKKYYDKNKEKEYSNHRIWIEKNKEKRRASEREWKNKRRQNDIDFRLRNNIGSYIRKNLKYFINENKEYYTEYIGCEISFYKKYLEKQFQNGMSWNNYGEWHIDHIKPLSLFNFSNQDDIYLAFNYKNTQPMWKIDNIKKGNKYASTI